MADTDSSVRHSSELPPTELPPTELPEYPRHPLLDIDIEKLPGPTLARLVEEVRNDDNVTRAYNRTYNRHNR